MSISRSRRAALKWELIDTAFNKMEYWEELTSTDDEELTDEERMYLRQIISSMAKYVDVTNHFLIL